MTQEDQDATIGRLVSRYNAAKTRRVALVMRLREHADALGKTAKDLREIEGFAEYWNGRKDGVHRSAGRAHVADFPSPEELRASLDELSEVAAEVRELHKQLKEAGISID